MPAHLPRAGAVLAALAALLVAGPALAAGAAPPVGTAAGPDVTWGVRAAEQDDGKDRSNFVYAVEPGGKVADTMVVSNHDSEALELDVYAADGFTTSSGQLDVVTRDTRSEAVGVWATLDSGHVTVPADGEVEVPFTVQVPDDATPGDYAGGLVTSLPQPEVEDGIAVDRRLGIRIQLQVKGDLLPQLAVEDLRVDYQGTINPFGAGDATVSYTVRNAGNVRLAAGQVVSVEGPFGLGHRDAVALDDVPELLPGESKDVTTKVSGVFPLFRLAASATLDPAPADVGLPVEPWSVRAEASAAAVPWALLVLVVIVVGGVVGTVLLARRRARRRRQSEDARVEEAVAQALRDRAGADAEAAGAGAGAGTGAGADAGAADAADAEAAETAEPGSAPAQAGVGAGE